MLFSNEVELQFAFDAKMFCKYFVVFQVDRPEQFKISVSIL